MLSGIRSEALEKVSNTFGKVSDVGTKLLTVAETAATAIIMGYGPEVVGFERAHKGLDMVNNAKKMLTRCVIKVLHLQHQVFHQHK